jgi:hypothetical protein
MEGACWALGCAGVVANWCLIGVGGSDECEKSHGRQG